VQVLVELVPEASKVEATIEQLAKKGQITDAAAQAYTKGNAELQKRNTLLASTEQNTRKVTEAQKQQIPTIGAVEKAIASMVDEFMIGVGEGIKEAAQEAGISVEQLLEKVQKLTNGTEETAEAQGTLKSQLRSLKEEIALLLATEDEWSEADKKRYDALIQKAGALNDAVGDATDAVSRAGSDTKGFDNLIDVTQGAAAGFAIAQGAAALFGTESEELQKTLVKLNAVMAIQQGLQQIQDLLSKKYIKDLLTLNKVQLIRNAELAIENGLQSSSVVVGGLATAAQWALNAAMAANPIGLVITLLASAVVLLKNYADAARDTAKEQAALNEAVEAGTNGLNAELEVYDRNLKKRLADLDAAGAKQSQKDEAELQTLRLKGNAIKEQLKDLNTVIQVNDKLGADNKAALELQTKLTKDLDDINTEGYVKKRAREKDLNDEKKQAAEDEKKRLDELETKTKEAREKAQKALQNELNDRKALAELTLLYVENGSEEELQARIEVINKTRDAELANAELTANQRALIYAKANKEIIDLQKSFNDQQAKLSAEVELLKAKNRVDSFQQGSKEYYAAQSELLVKQAELDTLSVRQSTDSEQKKAEQIKAINIKLFSDLEALRKTQFEKEINQRQAAIERLQTVEMGRLGREAQDVTKNNLERFNASQQLRMKELEALETQRTKINSMALAGAISTEEYEQQKTDIIEAENQKRFEIEQAYAQRELDTKKFIRDKSIELAGEVINTIADMEKQDREAALQANLEALNQRRQDVLDNANLTESQKRSLNKKLDAEERKLKNDAARKEREAEIKKAIALGIVAAIQSYANFGFPYGLIAAGFSVAATTLQVANLQSAPLPQYAKGTNRAKKGWALVGEEGPELVKLNGGERILTAKQTSIVEGAWEKAADPDAILSSRLTGDHARTLSQYSVTSGGKMEIDYERLGKAVAKYMPKASMSMNVDEKGFRRFVTEENYRLEIRNKDYSL